MKTLFTILALVCCMLVGSARAQVAYPLSFGVRAGITLSTSSVGAYEMTPGLTAGVMADYNLTPNFFLRSGLDFVMKGGKLDLLEQQLLNTTVVNTRKYSRSRLNYLQLPAMAGYRSQVSPDVWIYAAGGLYASYGLYGKGKYRFTTDIVSNIDVFEEYDSFDDLRLKRFDFGVLGSFGVEYMKFSVNVGYQYGLTNANKTTNSRPGGNPSRFTNGDSWHNMTATCTIGYKL